MVGHHALHDHYYTTITSIPNHLSKACSLLPCSPRVRVRARVRRRVRVRVRGRGRGSGRVRVRVRVCSALAELAAAEPSGVEARGMREADRVIAEADLDRSIIDR